LLFPKFSDGHKSVFRSDKDGLFFLSPSLNPGHVPAMARTILLFHAIQTFESHGAFPAVIRDGNFPAIGKGIHYCVFAHK
jgi:hypothetical protein